MRRRANVNDTWGELTRETYDELCRALTCA